MSLLEGLCLAGGLIVYLLIVAVCINVAERGKVRCGHAKH